MQQFKSALFEWELDPGYLVSSEVIACLPLDIDRERCKALLLRMVELGAISSGTGYLVALDNDQNLLDDKR